MKRLIALVLTFSLLLSGCGSPSNPTPDAEPLDLPGISVSKSEAKDCDAPSDLRRAMLSMLDNAIALEGTGNLFEIPCPELEQLSQPMMAADGEDLLFFSHTFDGDDSFTQLATVNHFTGNCLVSEPFDITAFAPPQVTDNHIILSDPETGRIRALTKTLEVEQEFSLPAGSGEWYLSPDQSTLYQLDWDGRISATSVQDTTQTQVLETLSRHNFYDPDNGRVPFTYIDSETQRAATGYLDLSTGTVEHLPIGFNLFHLELSGDCWLSTDYNHTYPVYLYDGTQKKVITGDGDETIYLVDPGKLLKINQDRTQLSLYNADGTHISTCTIPQMNPYDTPALVWSPSYGGYFFFHTDEDGKGTLMFWDTVAATEGNGLPMCSYEEYLNAPIGTLLDRALYTRAKELGDRYGLEICIADQCELNHPDFTASQATDPEDVSNALDLLEGVLSKYPEGFFEQLRYNAIEQVQISLMRDLIPSGGYQGSYNGFAYSSNDEYQVVVDIYSISDTTYFHEFSHIIDARLDWDAGFRDDALFSEDHWKSLSPESFSYTYSYDSDWPDIYGNGLESYFIDGYSCTFPTEDRARIMETAMGEWGQWNFSSYEPLRAKLAYYCDCIRDCFDTTGWPEITSWETYLHTS